MTKLIILFLLIVSCCNFAIGQESVNKKRALYFLEKAQIYHKKGDNEMQKLYSDSLLAISRANKFDKLELNAMMNQGIYFKNTNQLKKALKIYLKVLEKCKHTPGSEKNKIMTLVNLGNIYNSINEAEKAKLVFYKALPFIKNQVERGDLVKSAVYVGLGDAMCTLGQNDSALIYLFKLKKLADSLDNTYLRITALANISKVFNQKNDFNSGLKTAKGALKLNSTFKDSIFYKDLIFLNIGVAFIGLEEVSDAKYYLNYAKRVALKKKNTKIEMLAEKYLALVFEQLNDFEASQTAQKRFMELQLQYMEEKKETAVFDVEKEGERLIQITTEKSRIKTYILGSIFLIFALVSVVVFIVNRKNKREIYRQNKQLLVDYNLLQSQYATLKENLLQLSKEKNGSKNNAQKYKNSSLTEDDRERYMNQILDYMQSEKPFLDFDLTKPMLAEKIKIKTHHLSEVLTLSFEQNFYNFINLYRVDNAQKMLNDPAFENYKIEAIGYDSGFSSKASFNRVFKKITNKTPSEFRKKNKDTKKKCS